MKRIQLKYSLFLFFTLSLLGQGCKKVKNDFNYDPVNKLSITEPSSGKATDIKLGQSLLFSPVITGTKDLDPANLAYEWSVYEITQEMLNAPISVLSREHDLNLVVGAPFALGKLYNLTLKVTDNKTGVSAFIFYTLSVVNDFSQGWMVLEDNPGGGDFSMVLPNGTIFRNVYSALNGSKLPGKPLALEISSYVVTDDVTAASKKIYAIGENFGMELNFITLTPKFDFPFLFYKAPDVVKPTLANWFLGPSMGVIINDGKMHVNIAGGFPGAKKWAGFLLAPGQGLNYSLAPYVASGSLSSPGRLFNQLIVYDQIGKRFYAVNSPATAMTAFEPQASTVFDMNNVGMTMLFMEEAPSSNFNAIMKDALNDNYLLQFKSGPYTTAAPAITLTRKKIIVPGGTPISGFGASKISSHLFYATENKIYLYEPASGISTLQYTFPASEKVTLLRAPSPAFVPAQIAVITWNGTESKMYVFPQFVNGSTVGQIATPNATYTGFGKVIDLDYKR